MNNDELFGLDIKKIKEIIPDESVNIINEFFKYVKKYKYLFTIFELEDNTKIGIYIKCEPEKCDSFIARYRYNNNCTNKCESFKVTNFELGVYNNMKHISILNADSHFIHEVDCKKLELNIQKNVNLFIKYHFGWSFIFNYFTLKYIETDYDSIFNFDKCFTATLSKFNNYIYRKEITKVEFYEIN